MKRVTAALGILGLLLSSCGDDSSPSASPTTSSSPERSGSAGAGSDDRASVTTSPSGDDGNGAGAGDPSGEGSEGSQGAGGTGTETPPGDDEQPESIPVEVKFERECIRPGEVQTATFRTAPRAYVAYDAVYSDGTGSMAGERHYGGSNTGQADADGVWKDTFLVEVGAPPGPVKVNVIAVGGGGQGAVQARFDVAGLNGSCPSSG